MDLYNKSGVLIASVLLMVGVSIGWQAQENAVPAATEVEAMATQIGARSHALAAERRLQEWAELGSAVAQRELALRYLAQPDKLEQAQALFERAANAGDAQAAAGLVNMNRASRGSRSPAGDATADNAAKGFAETGIAADAAGAMVQSAGNTASRLIGDYAAVSAAASALPR